MSGYFNNLLFVPWATISVVSSVMPNPISSRQRGQDIDTLDRDQNIETRDRGNTIKAKQNQTIRAK